MRGGLKMGQNNYLNDFISGEQEGEAGQGPAGEEPLLLPAQHHQKVPLPAHTTTRASLPPAAPSDCSPPPCRGRRGRPPLAPPYSPGPAGATTRHQSTVRPTWGAGHTAGDCAATGESTAPALLCSTALMCAGMFPSLPQSPAGATTFHQAIARLT